MVKYHLITDQFGHSMWFMEHSGEGFSISTFPTNAKIVIGRSAAMLEAQRLEKVSGMTVRIKKV